MVSGTLTDVSGRTLSGQTVEAFYTSVHHGDVISVGLNCGLGAEKMRPYIERLAAVAACAVSAHPNAGLPDKEGHYDETPEMMAETVEQYLSAGLLNIVGGCCGTTPVHIAAIAAVAARTTPADDSGTGRQFIIERTRTAAYRVRTGTADGRIAGRCDGIAGICGCDPG